MLRNFLAALRRLRGNRKGVTALEYAVLAATAVVSIANFLPNIGSQLGGSFNEISIALNLGAEVPPPPPPPPDHHHDD
jgi:Flp pilus assembly pilin Flp